LLKNGIVQCHCTHNILSRTRQTPYKFLFNLPYFNIWRKNYVKFIHHDLVLSCSFAYDAMVQFGTIQSLLLCIVYTVYSVLQCIKVLLPTLYITYICTSQKSELMLQYENLSILFILSILLAEIILCSINSCKILKCAILLSF